MWTVVFGPKLKFHLSNVDTKIQALDFDVPNTTKLKKILSTVKVSTGMDTFSVDNSLHWTIQM